MLMPLRQTFSSSLKRRVAWALLVVLPAAIAAGVYWVRVSSAGRGPSYVTTRISHGEIARSVSATGTVNPQLTIIVGSYVSGVIRDLSCDFNTRVRKGQVCATIDPRPYQTVVDQAQAELGTAQAQLLKDRAALAYAEANYRRESALAASGYASRDLIDSTRNALDQAKAALVLDQAGIRQKQASLKAAAINLEYTRIVSPVDGTVVSRNVTIGQTVAASFQTPTLFLIATDLTRMQVDTSVNESDVGGLKVGDVANFTVEAFPKRVFIGAVTQVRQAPQTVQNVVTYDVIVTVANDDLALVPGMTATTRIVTERRENALRIPDQALRFSPAGEATAAGEGAKRTVWVLREGRVRPVLVSTGLDDDTYAECTSGEIRDGDEVVVGEQRAGETKASPQVRFGI